MKRALITVVFITMAFAGVTPALSANHPLDKTRSSKELKKQQIKEGSGILKSLRSQIKCIYRGDCSEEQMLKIRKNLKRLLVLAFALRVGYQIFRIEKDIKQRQRVNAALIQIFDRIEIRSRNAPPTRTDEEVD